MCEGLRNPYKCLFLKEEKIEHILGATMSAAMGEKRTQVIAALDILEVLIC